jgi:hypothetical protein
MKCGIIAAGGMHEFMNEYPGGIFCPEEEDTVGVAGIGIASVDMEGLGNLSGFRKGTHGSVGTEENGIGFAVRSFEHLKNLGPEC